MRHRVASKQFNRDTNHRKALLKNLVRALVEQGSIVTTEAKAKETKRLADRIIHKAQTDTVAVRQQLHRIFGRRDVVNTLVDRVAPAMNDRVTGFTTISAVGSRRGDNSALFKLSLVKQPERVGDLKSGKTYEKPKAAPAAKKAAPTKQPEAKKAAPKKAAAKSK